jgi:hypothetical protein
MIKIDVTDEQIDDRVDEALSKYLRQHYDGSEKVYLAHQLTSQEATTKTITLDDTILGVVDVFPVGFSSNPSAGGNFWNAAAFQVMLSELLGANGGASGTGGLSSYVVMRMSLNEMQQILVGKFPFRYSERTDVLYLDVAKEKLSEGMYVIIEAYRLNDPELYPDVWEDVWLQKYAIALIQQQWGQNLSKFAGAQLPGGITVNGTQIKMDAEVKLQELEDELIRTYSPILTDMIG